MDLFEILFIAAFILFPILEGILRQRRGSQGAEGEGEEASSEPGAGREAPRSAADMLPDDLWEVMTGERRPGPGSEAGTEADPGWSSQPEEVGTATELEPVSEDWRSEPWVVEEESEPVSLEYEGPEAYTLETPAPRPTSLERPLPSPEARHRAFHEKIDRAESSPPDRVSPLLRSLRSPAGLRQAVLVREILGPPKGLE